MARSWQGWSQGRVWAGICDKRLRFWIAPTGRYRVFALAFPMSRAKWVNFQCNPLVFSPRCLPGKLEIMELVLNSGIWCAEIRTLRGCSHKGMAWVRAGAVLSQTVIMELLLSTPVVFVTERCITLPRSPNPDVYLYVRNTNSNALQECNLALLCALSGGHALCLCLVHLSKF